MTEVSVRELKSHLTRYLRRLEQGEQFTVTRRGKPVALLAGLTADVSAMQAMRPLVAKGVVSWAGRKPAITRRRARLRGEGPTISEMVLEDRR